MVARGPQGPQGSPEVVQQLDGEAQGTSTGGGSLVDRDGGGWLAWQGRAAGKGRRSTGSSP
jgi:hypothetical protein